MKKRKRFKRFCNKCKELFSPITKYNTLCPKCLEETKIENILKRASKKYYKMCSACKLSFLTNNLNHEVCVKCYKNDK